MSFDEPAEGSSAQAALHVEPGQVWDPLGEIGAGRTPDGLLVVTKIHEEPGIFGVTFSGHVTAGRVAIARWHLVGFELPGGKRVMVGDKRTGWGRIWRVVKIERNASLSLQEVGKADCTVVSAEAFVLWASIIARDEPQPSGSVTAHAEPVAPPTSEHRRREIDAILREDARAAPAFAMARLRAVMASMEEWADTDRMHEPTLVRDILAELHRYEADRGGEMRPRIDPTRWLSPAVHEAVEVYERSRGLGVG
jgi:hypothetical protein